MVRILFIVITAVFMTGTGSSQTVNRGQSCLDGELAGGPTGACIIRVKPSVSANVTTILGPTIYRGGKATTQPLQPDIRIIRGAPNALEAPRVKPSLDKPEPMTAAPVKRCEASILRRADLRDGDRRYAVCVDDLRALDTQDGARALYRRVIQAAQLACPEDHRRFNDRLRERCVRLQVDGAVSDAGIAQLSLLHARLEPSARSRDVRRRVKIVAPL